MKKTLLLIYTIAVSAIICSCQEQLTDTPLGGQTGEITLQISPDPSFGISVKASEEDNTITIPTPDAGSFNVLIKNTADNSELYNGSFADFPEKKRAYTGNYNYKVTYGDPLSCGFEETASYTYSYFEASEDFTIDPQTLKTLSIQPKMIKTLVGVTFEDNVKSFDDYYFTLTSTDKTKTLTFLKDETHKAYFPAGQYTFTLFVEVDGQIKEYSGSEREDGGIIEFRSNTYINFVISIREGSFNLNITENDDITRQITLDETLPRYYGPTGAPKVTSTDYKSHSAVVTSVPTAADIPSMKTTIAADGRIGNCVLNLSGSTYLQTAMGASSVDLATTDQATIDKLSTLGIEVNPKAPLKEKYEATIEFRGLAAKCDDATLDELIENITVTVTDMKGKVAETKPVYTFDVSLIGATITAEDYNAFAKSIRKISGTATKGNPAKMKIQYRTSGTTDWIDASTSLTETTIRNLQPQTNYELRIVHTKGNTVTQLATATLLTEEELTSVTNSNMDTWSSWDYLKYDAILNRNDVYGTTYGPYSSSSSIYWDTNNSETAIKAGTTGYLNWKSYPMVEQISGKSGSAAQISTIGIDNVASLWSGEPGTIKWGKLYITGTNGQSFTSRPSKVSFYHKYTPCQSDKYKVYVYIKNGNTIIGEGKLIVGGSISDWTPQEVNITYSRIDLKAQTIYIEFVSGTVQSNNKPLCSRHNDESKPWRGSVLSVDDIYLVYD